MFNLVKTEKRTPSLKCFPSVIVVVVLFPLPTILEPYWKCLYIYIFMILVVSVFYHIRGVGLSVLTKILVNVFRFDGLCYCVTLETDMEKCRKSDPRHLL